MPQTINNQVIVKNTDLILILRAIHRINPIGRHAYASENNLQLEDIFEATDEFDQVWRRYKLVMQNADNSPLDVIREYCIELLWEIESSDKSKELDQNAYTIEEIS